ncbi:hypothetical protein Tco_0973003 [Tanacetum coccineum]
MAEEEKHKRDGDPEDTNSIAYIKERRDTPLLEQKDIVAVDNLGYNKDDEGIEWIKKGDPRNLKIPCMIGQKFIANAYIDVDLPMNIMSLAYYSSIRKNGYEYRGRNFVGLGRDMHVFVGNMSYVIDFTVLENIETNIDPSLSYVIFGRPFIEIACLAINRKHKLMTFMNGTKEITFKTPYKDPERRELSSEGHDLLSSRVIFDEKKLGKYFDALLDESSKILHSIEGTILEEKLFAEFDEFMAITADENSKSEFDTKEPPFKKITFNTDYKIETSLEEPPTDLELKHLPDNLEYVFLEEPSFLLVIRSS